MRDDVRLEPFDAPRYAGALHDAFAAPGDDSLWTCMSYGPFADAEACAVWARGFASFMRIAPDHGSIEIGHVVPARRSV